MKEIKERKMPMEKTMCPILKTRQSEHRFSCLAPGQDWTRLFLHFLSVSLPSFPFPHTNNFFRKGKEIVCGKGKEKRKLTKKMGKTDQRLAPTVEEEK